MRLSRGTMLAATAAAVTFFPPRVRAQQLETIRFAGVLTEDLTPVFYAVKNGLYEKAGLNVEVVGTASGSAATTAVIAGTYEMAKASPIAAMVGHLRGLPIVMATNASIWSTSIAFNRMVVALDSKSKSGADFNGKTGGCPALNDINSLSINAWIDKNGGDSKTVKWVEIPNSAAGPAIADHRIDMCSLIEPVLSAEIAAGHVRMFADAFSAISPRFCYNSYIANADWASKHGDAVRRWVRVTLEAGAYTNTHHAETAQLVADTTKIPLAIIQRVARVQAATLQTADPSFLQPLIDVAYKYGNIPRTFPAKEMWFS